MKTICITCKADCHNAGTMARIIECSSYEPGRILTNADRIRAMSDEELASEMNQRSISTICDIVCQGDCKAITPIMKMNRATNPTTTAASLPESVQAPTTMRPPILHWCSGWKGISRHSWRPIRT